MRWLLRIATGFVILGILLALLLFSSTWRKGVWKTFDSPNKEFRIVIYKYKQLMSSPGGAGDGPSLLTLEDLVQEKTLARQRFDQIIDEEDIAWSATNVSVILIGKWPLPRSALRKD